MYLLNIDALFYIAEPKNGKILSFLSLCRPYSYVMCFCLFPFKKNDCITMCPTIFEGICCENLFVIHINLCLTCIGFPRIFKHQKKAFTGNLHGKWNHLPYKFFSSVLPVIGKLGCGCKIQIHFYTLQITVCTIKTATADNSILA